MWCVWQHRAHTGVVCVASLWEVGWRGHAWCPVCGVVVVRWLCGVPPHYLTDKVVCDMLRRSVVCQPSTGWYCHCLACVVGIDQGGIIVGVCCGMLAVVFVCGVVCLELCCCGCCVMLGVVLGCVVVCPLCDWFRCCVG